MTFPEKSVQLIHASPEDCVSHWGRKRYASQRPGWSTLIPNLEPLVHLGRWTQSLKHVPPTGSQGKYGPRGFCLSGSVVASSSWEQTLGGPSISASLPPRRRVKTESTKATINNQKLTIKPSAASGAEFGLAFHAGPRTAQDEGVDSSFLLLANSLSVSPLDVTNGTQPLVSFWWFVGLWSYGQNNVYLK